MRHAVRRIDRGRIFGLLILVLLTLSACTTKLAYNLMDWGIEWRVQRLVALQEDQKLQTQQAIRAFHDWHRTTQLPLYADYLQQVQNRLQQGPITAAEIHGETDKIQLLVDQSVNKILPDAAKVLSSLEDRQVKELLASLAEEREEYQEERVAISRKKQIQHRYKEFLKHFRRWAGEPTKNQLEQVRKWSEEIEPFEALNLAQQKVWEDELARLLAQRADAEALLQGMRGLMVHRTDNWQPELEQVMDRNQDRTYALLADLLNGLNEKQKTHLQKQLADYRKIFTELARGEPAQEAPGSQVGRMPAAG